ncbi:MAG: sigma-E processing peptidase SpoIIGA [Coprococcus sp.]
MRIYVLYLDVYFLENVLLNLYLKLIFTLILTGRRIRFIRLLSASLIGGMMAILPIILRLRYGIAYILLILLTGLLVITIASGMRSMSEQWTAMSTFLCNVFCLE